MKKQSEYQRKKIARLTNKNNRVRNLKLNLLQNFTKKNMLTYVIKTILLLNAIVVAYYFLQDGHWVVAILDVAFIVYIIYNYRMFHKSFFPKI